MAASAMVQRRLFDERMPVRILLSTTKNCRWIIGRRWHADMLIVAFSRLADWKRFLISSKTETNKLPSSSYKKATYLFQMTLTLFRDVILLRATALHWVKSINGTSNINSTSYNSHLAANQLAPTRATALHWVNSINRTSNINPTSYNPHPVANQLAPTLRQEDVLEYHLRHHPH